MTWTKEKIDESIDNFYENNGRYPVYGELGAKNNLPSASPMRRLYDGLNNYYSSRDIKTDSHLRPNNGKNKRSWTKNEIDIAFDTFILENGRIPISRELIFLNNLPTFDTIGRIYGSLNKYYEYRGWETNKEKINWDKDSITKTVKEFLDGKVMLRQEDYKKVSKQANLPDYDTIRRIFGNIKDFCLYADIIPNPTYISNFEKEVMLYIKTITNEKIITNSRDILADGKELDIYLPNINLAIECNGDYWHSVQSKTPKDENYHILKTLLAKGKGITLIHIWENEWKTKIEDIKEYLSLVILGKESLAIPDIDGLIEIDNMKPILYSNITYMWETEPKLIKVGNEQCWDCGTTIFGVNSGPHESIL